VTHLAARPATKAFSTMTTTDQVLLQRLLMAACRWTEPDDLYVRALSGAIDRTRTSVTVHPASHATTQTYFGRFEASHWQRWTTVGEIEVHLRVEGHGVVKLYADDASTSPRILGRFDADGTEKRISFPATLDRFLDEGHVWLEMRTTTGTLTVSDVSITTTAAAEPRPTSIVICTFNRPDDCVGTLAALGSDPLVRDLVETIHVVDQGTRPVSDDPGFPAANAALGDRLDVIRQANLGGAGGFTRGMVTVRDRLGDRHGGVLVMDDDIRLDPETVLRMTAFARFARRPTIVGAQMLNLYHPARLVAQGENTDLSRFRGGVPSDRFSNVDLLGDLPRQRVDSHYAAWWSCLIPTEILDEIGLPLPVFFQWDDVELGLRARRHGYSSVALPGTGVWHADFELKDWDDWPLFFRWRNTLVVSSLYLDEFPGAGADELETQLLHFLVEYRYGLIATALSAVEAFLAGPDELHDGGPAALAAVTALRAQHSETHRLSPDDLVEMGLADVALVLETPAPKDPDRELRRLLRRQLRLRVHGTVAIDSWSSWWHSGTFSRVVATNRTQDGFRVRQISRRRSIAAYRDIRRTMKRLRRRGPAAQRAWREAAPQLSSRENWDRLFATGPD